MRLIRWLAWHLFRYRYGIRWRREGGRLLSTGTRTVTTSVSNPTFGPSTGSVTLTYQDGYWFIRYMGSEADRGED